MSLPFYQVALSVKWESLLCEWLRLRLKLQHLFSYRSQVVSISLYILALMQLVLPGSLTAQGSQIWKLTCSFSSTTKTVGLGCSFNYCSALTIRRCRSSISTLVRRFFLCNCTDILASRSYNFCNNIRVQLLYACLSILHLTDLLFLSSQANLAGILLALSRFGSLREIPDVKP